MVHYGLQDTGRKYMKASKNLDEWVCTMVEILDGKTTVLVSVNR